MKRDMDLFRDILFAIEETDTPRVVDFSGIDCTKEQLNLHLDLLYQAGYIQTEVSLNVYTGLNRTVYGNHITHQGYEFLGMLHSNTLWEQAKKKVIDTIGSSTLDWLYQTMYELAKQQLGL